MASMQTTILVDYASLFLQAFRSITVCHFILHLREVYLMGDDTGTNNPVVSSFLQFASQAVGNLGAPLDLDDMDSDGHSRADSSEWVSRNPLAAGLPMMSPSDEHVALNRDSMSSATESTVDLKDVFDDDCEEYAQRYLSLVRRRGTGEESILDGSHESRSLLCDEPDDMDAGATKNADNIAV
ncbi:hypothetical protein PsYK624_136870 [Phanerochaete sordida]|uniref:Uncharacterized protein n=1 Tax=Phanerochaete sordida TaxID=48140 RepID=A0A9P3LJE7_9APHY|nr:hypothetical protein PsYK624_136870 [Phanerochaete sordida]